MAYVCYSLQRMMQYLTVQFRGVGMKLLISAWRDTIVLVEKIRPALVPQIRRGC